MNYKINDMLEIAPSTIPKAGLGVFATSFIPRGTYLGHYRGKKLRGEYNILKAFSLDRLDPNYADSNYAFGVSSGENYFVLDATDPEHSNWTRYINCSRNEKEENVVYSDSDGKIRFYTIQNIYPGTELFFYYGKKYAMKLGIKYQSKYY